MNDSSSSNSGTGAGIAAGLLSLFAFPIGFFLFGIDSTYGADGGGLFGAVANGWNEGGSWMYAVLLLEFALLGGGALALLFYARGKPTVWALTPAISVAMMAIADVGFMMGMNGAMKAVTYANPLDRGIIMYGATAESMQTIHFALSFITATFVLHALGLALIGVTAKEKKPTLVLALGVFGLGVWLYATSRATSMELGAFKAMAHSWAPVRPTIVFISLAEAQSAQKLALGGMALVLIAVVLCAVLVRATPRVMAGVVGALLVTFAGIGGLRALGRPNDDAQKLMRGTPPTTRLLEMRATPEDAPYPMFTLGSEIHVDGRVQTLDEVTQGRDEVNLVLEAEVTFESLRETLGQVAGKGVKSVRLLGEIRINPPDDVKVPPIFEPVLRGFGAVRLGLTSACPEGGCAKLDDKGLSFDGARYDFVESSLNHVPNGLERGVPVELKGLTLPKLLECAKALDAQGLPMLLVLGE